jgi:hypothetical protein
MTERTMTRPRARDLTGAALVLGVVGALAACGSTDDGPTAEPSPAAEAVPAYEAARQDVLAAVQDVFGDEEWADDDASATEQDDGRCVVFLPDARTTREDGAGYDLLENLPAALAPVLEEHGFGEPSDVVRPEHGGSAYVESEDPAGWSVRVTADGDLVRLDVSGPVELDPCDEAGLPELG